MPDYLRDPAAIYARSFDLIRAEVALDRFPRPLHAMVLRLVHACGMPDIAPDLSWHGDPAQAGRDALARGAVVLVDAAMVRAGVMLDRLPAGNEVRLTLGDERTAALAVQLGTTRSAAAVELWRPCLEGAVVAIGNAPTALFHLLERLQVWPERPAAILAFPVGFVGAAESKEALVASRPGRAVADPARAARWQRHGRGRGERAAAPGMTWLTVVGIGPDGLDGLGRQAREAIAAAEVLVGGERHLSLVPEDGRPRLAWHSPLVATLPDLLALRPRNVVVLASGDPLWYGIGRLLLHHIPVAEVRVLPHRSAFQEACSRLGWAMEDIHPLSTHGRPIDALRRHLQPGRRLLVLTTGGDSPGEIGRCLTDTGYGPSRTWVLEELGGPAERVIAGEASALGDNRFSALNIMGIELAAERDPLHLVPGLPDDAYEHDGQLTKAEIRAVTMAALGPRDGEMLWDVGAGAGSVAIEWLRAGRGMGAVAIERDATRAARIVANAARLGVPELTVHTGEAPGALAGLPEPAAIFVGGGLAAPDLLEHCWAALRPGGRLVANAVTIAGEAALLTFHERHDGRLLRLAISRSDMVGGQHAWRPAMPVTQLTARK